MVKNKGKHSPHIDRNVSRKLKKALKNYPCKKTKLGRYIIDVMDSYYDDGDIGIGYYNGVEIIARNSGYEHPKGSFFNYLLRDENALWTFNYEVADKIAEQYDMQYGNEESDEINDSAITLDNFLKI